MGKRLKRIFGPILQQHKSDFLGKEVSVITNDGRTVRGTIKELQQNELCVLDMSLQVHRFPLTTIAEIVLDFEADY